MTALLEFYLGGVLACFLAWYRVAMMVDVRSDLLKGLITLMIALMWPVFCPIMLLAPGKFSSK